MAAGVGAGGSAEVPDVTLGALSSGPLSCHRWLTDAPPHPETSVMTSMNVADARAYRRRSRVGTVRG